MDTPSFFIGIATGAFIGVGYRFVYEFAKDQIQGWNKPVRAVNTRLETKVFAATVAASIEPEHIPLMWKSRMRAFVFHCEALELQGYSVGHARKLKERIGLTRPKQNEYLNLLKQAGLVHIEARETSRWLTDWHTRHKALATLPYPRNVEPPNFITLPGETDSTHNAQHRQ